MPTPIVDHIKQTQGLTRKNNKSSPPRPPEFVISAALPSNMLAGAQCAPPPLQYGSQMQSRPSRAVLPSLPLSVLASEMLPPQYPHSMSVCSPNTETSILPPVEFSAISPVPPFPATSVEKSAPYPASGHVLGGSALPWSPATVAPALVTDPGSVRGAPELMLQSLPDRKMTFSNPHTLSPHSPPWTRQYTEAPHTHSPPPAYLSAPTSPTTPPSGHSNASLGTPVSARAYSEGVRASRPRGNQPSVSRRPKPYSPNKELQNIFDDGERPCTFGLDADLGQSAQVQVQQPPSMSVQHPGYRSAEVQGFYPSTTHLPASPTHAQSMVCDDIPFIAPGSEQIWTSSPESGPRSSEQANDPFQFRASSSSLIGWAG